MGLDVFNFLYFPVFFYFPDYLTLRSEMNLYLKAMLQEKFAFNMKKTLLIT